MQITSVYAEESEIPLPPEYSAGAVVLIDASTGLVLYENNAREQMYPASITKVMTALIVLDHITDLEERIEFCDYAVWSIPRNSTHISMDVGETLSVREALYALMLESANEVSVALALHVAESVEEFADLMNKRALQLGAVNTNFVNPSGLPSSLHYTTAYDMALIMREAIHNPIFEEIISSVRFDIPPTERQSETRHLLNSNQMIRTGTHYNDYVVGGKTGWTSAAGNTLVTYAQHNDRRLITCVLQGAGAGAFTDTTALLDYGFALPMEKITVFDSKTYSVSIPVLQEIAGNQTEIGSATLVADRDLSFELPHDWKNSWLRYELSVPETLAPPVYEDTAVGRVTVFVQDIRVGEAMLTARDTVLAYVPGIEYAEAIAEIPEPETIQEPEQFEIFTGTFSFLNNEYILTLIIPISLSFFTLAIALFLMATREKRRMRRLLRQRRSRFNRYPHYRYKENC